MTFQSVERLLGGPATLGRRIRSALDLDAAVREGLPYKVVERIIKGRHPSRRTLDLRRKAARLTPAQSDRLARPGPHHCYCGGGFGSPDKTRTWLERETRQFGDMAPLVLLHSDAGATAVENLLGRIEHGIAA